MTDDEAEKRAWLARLFNEYGSALEGYLFRRTGNHADACELTQETYLQLLQVKDFRAIRDPKSYMFTTARHLADNLLSRRGKTGPSPDPDEPRPEEKLPDERDFTEEIADEETLARIRKAFAQLRPELRAAWHLKHAHGMTYEQIAEHLGVSKDTVKKYLQQVILQVQARLDTEDDE